MLDVHLGFSFSAGLFDYVLNFDRATRPWMLLPVGLVYFAVYYGAFRFFIRAFDLKTPGREADEAAVSGPRAGRDERSRQSFIAALGGAANLVSVDACTTRLRLVVADEARSTTKRSSSWERAASCGRRANAMQVVLGPIADQVAGDIRDRLNDQTAAAVSDALDGGSASELLAALGGRDERAYSRGCGGARPGDCASTTRR